MKRIFSIGLMIFLVTASISYAGQLNSTLGYTASVPSNWIILTREEVRKNPDLFEGLALQGVSKELLNSVNQRIIEGKVDLVFRKRGEASTFADNINVFKQAEPTPSSEKDLRELCSILPGELAKAYSRQVNVYQCEFYSINGMKTVLLDHDGVVPHTRSMQFFIPRSENISLVVTATAAETTLKEVRKEFMEIMSSFKNN